MSDCAAAPESPPAPLPTHTVGGVTYTVLFPDLLRPHTPKELEELETSISVEGFWDPITVDERNGVIDGATRLGIAARYGLPSVPAFVVPGLDADCKRRLAEKLNIARRMLPREDLEEFHRIRIGRVVDWNSKGYTTREIARLEGISESQARRDLDAGFAPGGAKRKKDPRGGPRERKDDAGTVAALGRACKKLQQSHQVVMALDGLGGKYALLEEIGVGRAETDEEGNVTFTAGQEGANAVCLYPMYCGGEGD